MRLSSIDIGSNAIRQLIVEIKPDGAWKVLKKHRETIRLGTDVFDDGLIHVNTQKRLILAFKRMARLNRKFKVDRSLAFATSAFRDAKNRKLILSAIYKKNLKAGLAVLGNISIGGAIERSLHFADKVTLLSENGAKIVLVPMDNLNEMTSLPASILGKTDTPFYANSQMLLQKAVLGD